MNLRLPLALLAILAMTGLALAGTWERFRGPGGLGIVRGENLPVEFDEKTNLIWKVAIPGLGNSSPVIWHDQLFLQTSNKEGTERSLLSLDPRTGKILWQRKFPGAKTKIHAKNTLASSTPSTDGEAIYLPLWDGKDVVFHALTMKGEPIWHKNLGEFKSQHGAGASPLIYQDKVFYTLDMDGKSIFYAFEKKTGKEAWVAPREAYRACYNMPQILENGANGTELLVTSTTAITSYNPDTGSRNWEWTWTWPPKGKQQLRTIGLPLELGGMLYACTGDGGGDRFMVALNLPTSQGAKPTQAWENPKDFPYVPALLSRGEHLYFVNDLGFAGCYEAKTGKRVWFERVPGTSAFTASPLLVEDKIYAASEEGDVHVLAADTKFHILARNEIGECVRATPAVADGRLFVRGSNHLFCFGKKN